MLVKVGLVVLAVWLVGLLGLFGASDLKHVLLLVGLLLLMIGALKARDAAMRSGRNESAPKR